VTASGRKTLKQMLLIAAAVLAGAILGGTLYAYAPEIMRTSSTDLPLNFIAVSSRISTSGQPSEAQLGDLKSRGYGLVINLAPPATIGSISREGQLVAQTGVAYVNIPVDWRAPHYEEFELFSNILAQAGSRHVLVHCQINKRASLFTFLYRVIHDGVPPDAAYEKLSAVWVPDAQWKAFALATLKRHHIEYDFY
jgi:protein tyrosine phosphatase (PTP) superfamily phosphohydrolase (DUF442 family)